MIEKVLENIKNYNMINKGDKVLVALSGGPDSVSLIHSLNRLKHELDIEICAAHVNHCLRGEDSDKDEQYVIELCNNMGITLFNTKVDVRAYEKKHGVSCEVAGRNLRYEFFNKIKTEHNIQKIALAHNANDQAETLLMRIMRGTGLEGLCGIRAIRENLYIRPIINITRSEIESYCEEEKLNPRIDKTNLQNIYTRNKVRLELIPYIEKNFNEDIIGALNRLAYNIQMDNEILEKLSKEYYERYCDVNENKVIISKEAFKEHHSILTRIIRKALTSLTGDTYNFEKNHIYSVIELQSNSTGKKVMLPKDIIAYNNYGDLHIAYSKGFTKNEDNICREYNLIIGQSNYISNEGIIISLEILNREDISISKSNKYLKYFDYEKVEGDIKLRYKRHGDQFKPLGMRGTKTLKKTFIDMKVDKDLRDRVPLICFKDEIAWIVGYRVSESFKVTEHTKKILEIKVERG